MRIIVLSDTHIPISSRDLPPEVYAQARAADMIIHAGDITEPEFLNRLKKIAKTVAVCGNMDSPDLRKTLRSKEVVRAGSVRIGIIHGHGAPSSLEELVLREFKNVDVIVFGHSHIPLNKSRDGVLLFNPGSPTDKIFATQNSFGILSVSGTTAHGEIIRIERGEQ
ncbi:MAG: metallophosphoesterase family protein [Candidatus Omnitrophota bacterium]